ncbi:hypothetical protein NQ317_016580 [Molorchus minor]|uniref:MADF domain-containing protein n=1 Tax=Molorchus minor TaxID=1323400 RepID=A0ABQ9J799_9CUCU|nr:hypothetical protein NQ317_016580 [Molorchus minor]
MHSGNCKGVEMWVRCKPQYIRDVYKCKLCGCRLVGDLLGIEIFETISMKFDEAKLWCYCGGKRESFLEGRTESVIQIIHTQIFSNPVRTQRVKEDSEIGYIFEADIEYPQNLHDYHNELPFCSEFKCSPISTIPKLILDLNDKTKYIIHYHLNTFHRTNAKNDFEKGYFKLKNNAVYGKTMENVDKRKDVKIVTHWESHGKRLGARALIAKPNFHSVTRFTEDMVAVQLKRSYQNVLSPKTSAKAKIFYHQNFSLTAPTPCVDFYDDIKNDIFTHFDTSEYELNNIYNIPLVNKKVIGLMKDENKGKILIFIKLNKSKIVFAVLKCLYDKADENFKNKRFKENGWKGISEIMGESGEYFVVERVQQRWSILRNRYAAEKRKFTIRKDTYMAMLSGYYTPWNYNLEMSLLGISLTPWNQHFEISLLIEWSRNSRPHTYPAAALRVSMCFKERCEPVTEGAPKTSGNIIKENKDTNESVDTGLDVSQMPSSWDSYEQITVSEIMKETETEDSSRTHILNKTT